MYKKITLDVLIILINLALIKMFILSKDIYKKNKSEKEFIKNIKEEIRK